MKTKFLPIFIIITLLFTACKSKEEKAEELIKNDLYKTLYDFASYEPIETKVDSAFSSIYRDSIILHFAYLNKAYLDKANEYLAEMKNANSSLQIWSDSYSSYGRAQYDEAKEKYQENLDLAKICLDKMKENNDSIKQRATKISKEFVGWKVTHKFRCKTKGGNSTIANYLYITDPDIKKITFSQDLDDESFTEITNLIDEAMNSEDEGQNNLE